MGGTALAALQAELNTAGIATIKNPRLPTYEKACFESQMGWQRAEAVRQAEINARIDKQMSVEIGFVERLVIFWSNHFSMSVDKTEAVRGTIGQWERDVVRRHVLGRFGDMLHATIKHPAMLAYLDNDSSLGPNSPVGLGLGHGLQRKSRARDIGTAHRRQLRRLHARPTSPPSPRCSPAGPISAPGKRTMAGTAAPTRPADASFTATTGMSRDRIR